MWLGLIIKSLVHCRTKRDHNFCGSKRTVSVLQNYPTADGKWTEKRGKEEEDVDNSQFSGKFF